MNFVKLKVAQNSCLAKTVESPKTTYKLLEEASYASSVLETVQEDL